MCNGCLIGLLTVGVGADSYPFACSLDHFPPTRLPYSSLQWRFVPSLTITCYAMLSWYPWEASLLFFFFKGNRSGVVGWEGEVARRRTGKSREREGKMRFGCKARENKRKKNNLMNVYDEMLQCNFKALCSCSLCLQCSYPTWLQVPISQLFILKYLLCYIF